MSLTFLQLNSVLKLSEVTNVKGRLGPALGLSQFFSESCRIQVAIQVEASHLMQVLLLQPNSLQIPLPAHLDIRDGSDFVEK